MEPLDVYVDAVRHHERSGFVAAHPDPVLVVAVKEGTDDSWRTFSTVQLSRSAVSGEPMPLMASRYRVVTVRKVKQSPFADRITLGRAANNDLIVKDGSISKLHACFRVGADGVSMTDLGSKNGTMHGERVLRENETVALKPGDALRLGSVSAVFQDSAGFYDFLAALR